MDRERESEKERWIERYGERERREREREKEERESQQERDGLMIRRGNDSLCVEMNKSALEDMKCNLLLKRLDLSKPLLTNLGNRNKTVLITTHFGRSLNCCNYHLTFDCTT